MNTKIGLRMEKLELICCEVRRRLFATILNTGSGHLGGSSSSVELMVALYFGGILRFDRGNPRHPLRDRVLVRGHLGPLRYSIFSLLGWVSEKELKTYRSFGSRLQGHESMELVPGVDITPSGSLGMILSYGVGAAYSFTKLNNPARAYVFLGDGEEQEGNISEAARFASHLKLGNLICIIDKNKKQLSQTTAAMDGGSDLRKIWEGYGWCVKEIIDGHSIREILSVLHNIIDTGKPTVIIANTTKGYRLRDAKSHHSGYHTLSTCPKEYVAEAIVQLGKEIGLEEEKLGSVSTVVESVLARLPCLNGEAAPVSDCGLQIEIPPSSFEHFDDVFLAYCRELVAIFAQRQDFRLYVMTADWIPDAVFMDSHFDRPWVNFVNVGIREQHLFAMAHGIAVSDPRSRILIIGSDAFIYRAADQLHAITQAASKMIIVGTDSGICEGRNGSTHQSRGQPGMLVSMPGLSFLEPADMVDLHNCFNWALTEYGGPVYIRLHSTIVVRLPASERKIVAYLAFQPKSHLRLILIGSGFLLGEMVRLAYKMDDLGIGLRVVNIVDLTRVGSSLAEFLESGVPILTVYNGNPAVLQALVAKVVAEQTGIHPSLILGHGFTVGTTGKFDDLARYYQFDAEGIEKVIRAKFGNSLFC